MEGMWICSYIRRSKLTKCVLLFALCVMIITLASEGRPYVQAWNINTPVQPRAAESPVQSWATDSTEQVQSKDSPEQYQAKNIPVLSQTKTVHKYKTDGSHKKGRNKTQPHILLILADDHGFHDVGYHGSDIKTPNLDMLALSGVRLENYYVQPICTPTRGQLLTGRYQIHTGLQYEILPGEPMALGLDNPTIAEKLKEAGYATHIVGKWHVGYHKKEFLPTNRGFDSFFGMLTGHEDYYTHRVRNYHGFRGIDLHENDQPADIEKYEGIYSTTLFEKKSTDIIEHHDTTKPLFLYLPFQAVHGPAHAPPESCINKNKHIEDATQRYYAGRVSCMDEAIGNVVKAMKRRGMWDNTVLIFSSDNGGAYASGSSNWPLRGEKGNLWEGAIRVVGFVHSKLIDDNVAGSVSKELMHVTDWFPTLINLADGNLNGVKPLDGYDQWNTIKHGARSPRTEILHDINPMVTAPGQPLYENTFSTTRRGALRMGDWKIITGYPVKGPRPLHWALSNKAVDLDNLWLFNITNDPGEYNELSDQFPEIIQRMLHRLEEHEKTMVPSIYAPRDERADPAMHNGYFAPWL